MGQGAEREPTMEEILASIRRIISEEGDTPPGTTIDTPEPEPLPEGEPYEVQPSEVLELTRPLPDTIAQPGLVSDETAAVASQTLSALSSLVVRDYEGAENTLEGLVREMLKPMLRDWLDRSLPELVEKMVAREISRITGRES